MSGYSIDTLKWGLTRCYDRDVSDKLEPFSRVNAAYWSVTSGHPEETILAVQEQIKSDRGTRVEPAVDPDLPCEGK